MSHFTKVETKIKDLVILKQTLTELGYEFVEGDVKVRGYQGATENAELVVKTKSSYDIGVQRTAEGYVFLADWEMLEYRSGIEREQFLKAVNKKYSYLKVMNEVKKQGYQVVEETVDEKQTVKLVVRRWQ